MMANGFPWCKGQCLVLSWAKKVFPNDGTTRRWKSWSAIFNAIRVTEGGDAVKWRRDHCAYLEEMAAD